MQGSLAWLTAVVAMCLLAITAHSYSDAFDCSFAATYPKQYVAYKVNTPLEIDGAMDEPAWTVKLIAFFLLAHSYSPTIPLGSNELSTKPLIIGSCLYGSIR